MAEADWYYTTGDDRLGPVPFTRLKELARSGEIDPRSDLVWSKGMADWVIAGEMEGLFSKRVSPVVTSKEEPEQKKSNRQQVTKWKPSHSGVGRVGFIVGTLFLPAFFVFIIQILTPYMEPWLGNGMLRNLPLALMLIAPVPAIFSAVGRFRDLGMSPWWILGFLVPLLNLWLFYRCAVCPSHYAFAKKLDGPGWIMTALFWLLLLLSVALPAAALLKGDQFPELKTWFDKAKAGEFSIPWKMKDGAKPASGPVKK